MKNENQIASSKANLLLITIDALRADHLGCYGYNKAITPNLDRLAKRGALFHEAISNGPYTAPSFITVFSSNYPGTFPKEILTVNELNPSQFFSKTRPSFVDALKKEGYSTGAFVDHNPYISSFFGYDRNFDEFVDFLSLFSSKNPIFNRWMERLKSPLRRHKFVRNIHPVVTYYIFRRKPIQGAKKLTDRAISWLEKQQGSFFLWIHYMDVHAPYVPPVKYLKLLQWAKSSLRYLNCELKDMPQSTLKLFVDLYDEEIRYVDKTVGDLLDRLKQLGLWENTFVIATADHGEEFGEHGDWGVHKAKLYDELLRVPLIIAGPRIKSSEVSSQVGLIDLAPTVLDLLNVSKNETFQGRTLIPLLEASNGSMAPIVSECFSENRRTISYRNGEWKYIASFDYTTKRLVHEELYNLQSDPRETSDLASSEGIVEEFRARILSHVAMEEQQAAILQGAKIKEKVKRLKIQGKL
jgi:arylsulfatase A-like enzyme